MRYKVKMSESLEFVIEGKSEEEVLEWLRGNTIKEVRVLNKELPIQFTETILEKTVMPADVAIEDCIEDITEITPEDLAEWQNAGCGIDLDAPWNK